MSILAILGLLPVLINAVESLFHAFPGSGAVKKSVVLTSLGTIVSAANSLGSHIDPTQVQTVADTLIDDYVAVQNALGTPGFVKAQSDFNK